MKRHLLLLVLALQCTWILATIARQEWRLHSAPTVLLETAPVDPRDLLRGDFVILNYEISSIPDDRLVPPLTTDTPTGTRVYVTLEPTGEFHRVASASTQLPPASETRPFLQGQVARSWNPRHIRVDYGLERYYVPEGTGNPTGKLTVRAAIARSGLATIREVYVDGQPYRESFRNR